MTQDPQSPLTKVDIPSPQPAVNYPVSTTAEQVVKPGFSLLNLILWLLALTAIIGALVAGRFLPSYWPPAAQPMVLTGVIVGLVVVAIGLIAMTRGGAAIWRLAKEAPIEIRRITWPTKRDTLQSTWIVLVLTAILSVILAAMDYSFSKLIEFIISR